MLVAAKQETPHMALPLTVDTLDAVPAAFRSEYSERDGKHHLQVDGIDAVLKPHRDGWAKEKSTLESELAATQANERRLTMEMRVAGALAKAGASSNIADLLAEALSDRIKFETKDGKRAVKIVAADGETPMAGSIDDLVKEAVTKWPALFGASGGETPQKDAGGSGGKTISRTEWDALDPVAKHSKVVKEGFTISETKGSEALPRITRRDAGKTITRMEFDKLGPIERASAIKEGARVVD
jgi:hypothetical protein